VTEHEAFLAEVLAHPDDDGPRLIYADWLQGQESQAARDRGEFIRVQCELAAMDERGEGTIDSEIGHTCVDHPCPVCAQVDRYERLQGRERALWPDVFDPREWRFLGESMDAVLGPVGRHLAAVRLVYHRGFVGVVSLPAMLWLDHGAAAMATAPIREVRFTNVDGVELEANDDPHGGFFHVRVRGRLGFHKSYNRDWFLANTINFRRYPLIGEYFRELLNERWPGVTFYLPGEPGIPLAPEFRRP
jgi:uncharacterized protein (TIGR02996 family)